MRERWPHANVCTALFNTSFAVWKPFLQVTETKSTISWKQMSKPHSRSCAKRSLHSRASRSTSTASAARYSSRRDGLIARERDYVCVFGGQIRAALALSESEQGVWKGKYTRMCLRLQCVRDVFADQPGPCFLGGACMFPPSSLQRSSDPSLRTLEVVIDGGTCMIQTTHRMGAQLGW